MSPASWLLDGDWLSCWGTLRVLFDCDCCIIGLVFVALLFGRRWLAELNGLGLSVWSRSECYRFVGVLMSLMFLKTSLKLVTVSFCKVVLAPSLPGISKERSLGYLVSSGGYSTWLCSLFTVSCRLWEGFLCLEVIFLMRCTACAGSLVCWVVGYSILLYTMSSCLTPDAPPGFKSDIIF